MTKTQTQKFAAIVALGAMAIASFGSMAYATNIGTGSISGSGASATPIVWDNNFPGFATGSVSDVLIQARVNPSLNMVVSTGAIDLGVLVPGVASNGSLDIEVGTNAVNGVSITAFSQSGGLTNVSDNDIQINNEAPTTADPVQENYTWASTLGNTAGVGNSDSAYDASFTSANGTVGSVQGLDSAKEVIDTTTQYNVYTTNRPEATLNIDDVTFEVSATADIQTPAGDYEDRVTFTVVGNF